MQSEFSKLRPQDDLYTVEEQLTVNSCFQKIMIADNLSGWGRKKQKPLNKELSMCFPFAFICLKFVDSLRLTTYSIIHCGSFLFFFIQANFFESEFILILFRVLMLRFLRDSFQFSPIWSTAHPGLFTDLHLLFVCLAADRKKCAYNYTIS